MIDKKEEYYFSLNPADENNPSLFIVGQLPESNAKHQEFKKKQIKPIKIEEKHTESPKKFGSDVSNSRKIRVLFTAAMLTSMLIFLFLFASPSMTSISNEGNIQLLATYTSKIDYALMNNESFSFDLNNANYNLEDTDAVSLGLSGAVIGEGVVKVYLVDEQGKEYALYDNEVEKSDNFFRLSGITGMEINTEIASAVEEAQAYANAAQASANAAQTYANNANNAHINAQTAATNARSGYNQAKIQADIIHTSAASDLANKAKAAADNAQKKADESKPPADDAQKRAYEAQGKANEAQNEANKVAAGDIGRLDEALKKANEAQGKANEAQSYAITAESKEAGAEGYENQVQNYFNQILAMLPPTPPTNPPVNPPENPPINETQPPVNPPENPPINETQPPVNPPATNQSTQNPQEEQNQQVITNQTSSQQIKQIKEAQKKAEEAAKKAAEAAAKAKKNECKDCKSLNDIIKKNNNEINSANTTNLKSNITIGNIKEIIQEELKDINYNLIIIKVKETEMTNLNLSAPNVISNVASETKTETINRNGETLKTISGGTIMLNPEEKEKIVTMEEKIKEILPTIQKFEYSCVDTCYTKMRSGKYALRIKIDGRAAVWLNRLIIEA